ncbi:unnamed protein product [Orchesella dallaii]|uniref:Uncharacterized protein n=1 Tax=Orchesella dallaii TaxID=48710 RepID=A0ABP1PNB8_9HEXA
MLVEYGPGSSETTKQQNEASAKTISHKSDDEESIICSSISSNPMEFDKNVRESLENLKDLSVTEIGACETGDVEPKEKLEMLGIYHPCGGARFYNRMFPDIPFQYVGKNPAFLGPSPKLRMPPLQTQNHQLNLTGSNPKYTLKTGDHTVFEINRGIGEQVCVRNGEASKPGVKRGLMNEKVVKIKAGTVQPYQHCFGEVCGGGMPELVQITSPALYQDNFLAEDMYSADAFFVSIPNSAHSQTLYFPCLGAYSPPTDKTDRERKPQQARPEFECVGVDTPLGRNSKSNVIEVIDLSDEEDSIVISNCTPNKDVTNSQVKERQEGDISTSLNEA